jgi:hypothetical protein
MKQVLGATLIIVVGALVIAAIYLLTASAMQRSGMPFTTATNAPLGQALAPIVYASQPSGISVNGEGLVKAKPDVAKAQIAVDVTHANVAEAQQDAATRMDRVMARLKEMGVAADDIKTAQYALYPLYDYSQNRDQPKLTGYRVVNTISVTMRQLDKVGAILDAVTSAGATRIDGVSFSIADPTPLQSQARASAVKQARSRAEELAKAAGVSLGKVAAINESTAGAVPELAASTAKAIGLGAAETPISPGELEIRVSVQVNFLIQ